VSFIVNGAEWDFNGITSADAQALIERALEFIETSLERREVVAVGEDFQTRPMNGAESLWELFHKGSALALPPEMSRELEAWLMRAPVYSSGPWPPGFADEGISIDDAPSTPNPDVEWVHCAMLDGVPIACITLGPSRLAQTATAAGNAQIHFVNDEAGRKAFWRSAIVVAGDTLASLVTYAPKAYPDLHFVKGVVNDAGKLGGGYLASRERVQMTLATLDDWGSWAFTCPPPVLTPQEDMPENAHGLPSNQIIEHRFKGFNLDAAPEKPNVYAHADSRKARETKIGMRTLYCEWHAKLEGHRNRIHFHAPVDESGHKVVVGMIHEHLPLP
jgi:hypothetical protein